MASFDGSYYIDMKAGGFKSKGVDDKNEDMKYWFSVKRFIDGSVCNQLMFGSYL
jgi:hypothetical protein